MGDYGDKFNQAIAAELRAQRARKQFTLDQLAEKTGLSKATVLRYLNGQRQIPMDAFGELCLALEADAAALFLIAHEAAQ